MQHAVPTQDKSRLLLSTNFEIRGPYLSQQNIGRAHLPRMSEVQVKEERKRRADDGESPTEALYPPAKRQNTNDYAASSSYKTTGLGLVDTAPIEEEAEDPEDPVVVYQKQAIWRQMREYKRLWERASERMQSLEAQQANHEDSLAAVHRCWVKLYDDLELLLGRIGGDSGVQTEDSEIRSNASELLQRMLDSSSEKSGLDAVMQKQRQAITGLLARIFERIQTISERPQDSNADLRAAQKNVDALQARCRSIADEASALRSDCELHKRRLKILQNELETTNAKLMAAEKRVDRLKMGTSTTPKNGFGGPNSCTTPEAKVADDTVDDMTAQFLSASRLKEIEQLKEEKIRLEQELDQLRLQNSAIEKQSSTYANLDAEFKYQTAENMVIKERYEKFQAQVVEYQMERSKYREQMENEEAARRKILEAEIRKLESDLTRIRGNRDNLQQMLDLRSSKDELEIAQNQEIRTIANNRKDRIVCLEADVQRLKMAIAANMGDRALLEFFDQNPDGNPLEELRRRLSEAEAEKKSLERSLRALRDASDSVVDRQTLICSERKARDEISRLQDKLREYEDLYGAHTGTLEEKQLLAQLQEKGEKVAKLEVKLEYHQKTEARLLSEIETIGKAWSELEEQNSRKVLNLAEKEDQILRLLAERTKYDQKCAMLNKQVNTVNNHGIALKRQSDKQLEQIRKLEEREKTLTQQLHLLEKELAAKVTYAEGHQQKAGEYMRQITDLKEKMTRAAAKYDNLNNLLKKKVAEAADEADLRRRAEEQAEVMRRRLDSLSKQDPDSTLQRQLDEYKVRSSLAVYPCLGEWTRADIRSKQLLLKCSSCNTNFKSHCLLKCMHTFWYVNGSGNFSFLNDSSNCTFSKDCIDDMYSSRQRKCPTCGIAFAQNDIRQVYL
ncbi:E3 ubiquitin-protein ligase bre1 [Borealophlyctis nickersoniae]|nr:E3 ubiquitin-protein ligase bre1 [Borealophlyctis nickersoniae]